MVGKVTAKRVDPSKIPFGVLIDVYFKVADIRTPPMMVAHPRSHD